MVPHLVHCTLCLTALIGTLYGQLRYLSSQNAIHLVLRPHPMYGTRCRGNGTRLTVEVVITALQSLGLPWDPLVSDAADLQRLRSDKVIYVVARGIVDSPFIQRLELLQEITIQCKNIILFHETSTK